MISKRLLTVPASPIRKLVPLANAVKKKGIKVYHLNIGDPDIETPTVMLDVVKRWNTNPIGYSQSHGDLEFLQSLKTYYHRLGYSFIDTNNIQVTSGGSEALMMTFFAVASPGEEIIVFEPFYTNYNSYAAITGTKLVPIRTKIQDGFRLPDRKTIERKITKKTRAILICSPNNPTGTVLTKAEVEMIVSIAKKHKLFLLADEVYREFVFDGKKQISLLSYMKSMPETAVLLDSMSKRYSVCGVRLGTIVSLNADLMAGVLRMAQGRLSSGLIDQAVARELTKVPASYINRVRNEYQKRRDVLYAGISAMPGMTLRKPEGAFYMIVGLPVDDAERFCSWLLTDFSHNGETLMLAPAAGFYATKGLGKNEVRIAYVLNTTKLKRCLELLSLALRQYKQ